MSRRALSSSRKSESVRGMTKGRRRPKAIAKTVFASFTSLRRVRSVDNNFLENIIHSTISTCSSDHK